jgi:hypothetical protein
MTRAAIRGAAMLLAATLFIAGCTSSAPSQAAHRAGGAPARSALASAERRVRCGRTWQQPGARLPAGFVAEAAVLCATAVRLVRGREHVVFSGRAADRGLGPLGAALRLPSARPTPGGVVSCPAQLVTLVVFLIDRDGQIIRPVIPTDGCELVLRQVLAALQHVPWVTVHASALVDRVLHNLL